MTTRVYWAEMQPTRAGTRVYWAEIESNAPATGTNAASGSADLPEAKTLAWAESAMTLTSATQVTSLKLKDIYGDPIRNATPTLFVFGQSVGADVLSASDDAGDVYVAVSPARTGSSAIAATFDGVTTPYNLQITVESSSAPPEPPTVAISPASVSLYVGQTQQFSATITGGPPGASVTWAVQSGSGTIDSDGLYTAPDSLGTSIVRATYETEYPFIFREATVTVAAKSGTVRTRWSRKGLPLSGIEFDYYIFSSSDEFVAKGTATTDAGGYLSVSVPATYSGQTVQVFVNNLGSDLDTTGKIHGQQVVTVT